MLGDRLSIVLCGWDEPRRFRPVLLVSTIDERVPGGQVGTFAAEVPRVSRDGVAPPWHVPVLVNEVLQWLPTHPEATVVDATAGLGGHSAALLSHLTTGDLIALDRDPHSLNLARTRLAVWAGRVTLHHASFSQLPQLLAQLGRSQVDGILLDLGMSSWQLAQAERGFSFQLDSPLDMRFDLTTPGLTAAQLLRRLSLGELTDLFQQFGDERHAARIARAIVDIRRKRPLRTTRDLVTLIEQAVPSRGRTQHLHPATRVFQALRIAVNREVEELERFLSAAPQLLSPGGRLVVISFHSLEDRCVKRAMQQWKRDRLMQVLTPHPVRPSVEEITDNPRARSAKLRACERL